MHRWLLRVETPDGERDVEFYSSDVNPLEEHPDRFEFPFENAANYGDVTRELVDGLDEDRAYWVIDDDRALADYFPQVPDVPPAEANPTWFTAVPKDAVTEVTHR